MKNKILYFLSIIILFSLFSIKLMEASDSDTPNKDEDDGSTIMSVLENLTCDTKGGSTLLLRDKYSHTCIPSTILDMAIATVKSPVQYLPAILRLKMHDNSIDEIKNNCAKDNKANYDDLKLTFAVCNNALLEIQRLIAVAKAKSMIAEAIINGDNVWDKIKENFFADKSKYHKIYTIKENDKTGSIDVPPIAWKVQRRQDKLCVSVLAFDGWTPVGCKYIKEPFIESQFDDCMTQGGGSSDKCKKMGNCYYKATKDSKNALSISTPIIQCVKDITSRLIIGEEVKSLDNISDIQTSKINKHNMLFSFQKNMHGFVMILLVFYVMIFGINMITGQGGARSKQNFIQFIITIILVAYFSVGININNYTDDNIRSYNGMTQFVLPFSLNLMNILANFTANVMPSGLCNFNISDYPSESRYLAIWDMLDCKMSHYIGLNFLQDAALTSFNSKSNIEPTNFSIPPYLYLFIPALLTGSFSLAIFVITYPLLVISLGAFLVSATVISIISIVLLCVLAPLFIPMYLFNYTKGFFTSWFRLLLSFVLQPMVIMMFISIVMSVYDRGFYGTCKYKAQEINFNEIEGDIESNRKITVFTVNESWNEYDSAKQVKNCKSSLGYLVNHYLNPIVNGIIQSKKFVLNRSDKTLDSYKNIFTFLKSTNQKQGDLTNKYDVDSGSIKDFMIALFISILLLYVMIRVAEILAAFAADMTKGIVLDKATIGATDTYKATKSTAKTAAAAGDAIATGGASAAKDQIATTSSKEGSDKISTGSKAASDKISTNQDKSANSSARRAATDKIASDDSDKDSQDNKQGENDE